MSDNELLQKGFENAFKDAYDSFLAEYYPDIPTEWRYQLDNMNPTVGGLVFSNSNISDAFFIFNQDKQSIEKISLPEGEKILGTIEEPYIIATPNGENVYVVTLDKNGNGLLRRYDAFSNKFEESIEVQSYNLIIKLYEDNVLVNYMQSYSDNNQPKVTLYDKNLVNERSYIIDAEFLGEFTNADGVARLISYGGDIYLRVSDAHLDYSIVKCKINSEGNLMVVETIFDSPEKGIYAAAGFLQYIAVAGKPGEKVKIVDKGEEISSLFSYGSAILDIYDLNGDVAVTYSKGMFADGVQIYLDEGRKIIDHKFNFNGAVGRGFIKDGKFIARYYDYATGTRGLITLSFVDGEIIEEMIPFSVAGEMQNSILNVVVSPDTIANIIIPEGEDPIKILIIDMYSSYNINSSIPSHILRLTKEQAVANNSVPATAAISTVGGLNNHYAGVEYEGQMIKRKELINALVQIVNMVELSDLEQIVLSGTSNGGNVIMTVLFDILNEVMDDSIGNQRKEDLFKVLTKFKVIDMVSPYLDHRVNLSEVVPGETNILSQDYNLAYEYLHGSVISLEELETLGDLFALPMLRKIVEDENKVSLLKKLGIQFNITYGKDDYYTNPSSTAEVIKILKAAGIIVNEMALDSQEHSLKGLGVENEHLNTLRNSVGISN